MMRLVPLIALLLMLLASASAPPAALQDIAITDADSYVQLTLSLDRGVKPILAQHGPEILIELPDTFDALPPETVSALASPGHRLIAGIGLTPTAAGDLQLSVSLTTPLEPFVARVGSQISLRFYRGIESSTPLGAGATLLIRHEAGREHNLTVYKLQLNGNATRHLRSMSGASLGKSLLRPSDIAALTQADIVVNGGFFSKNGEHLSTFIEDGQQVAAGVYPSRPMLALDTLGKPHIGRFQIEPASTDAPEEPCCCVEGETRFKVVSAIGAGPMLVEHGRKNITVEQDSIKPDIATGQRARTGVGLTRRGDLVFIVVREDESDFHPGVSLDELAKLLLDAGAVTAMNFDGGGSSAIVVAGELLTPVAGSERPVSNAWILQLQHEAVAISPNSIAPPSAQSVPDDSIAVELDQSQPR